MAQASHQIPGGGRKPGPKPLISTLSDETKFAIRYTYLVDPDATIGKLSDQFSIPTYTVSQLLTGPEYDSVRTVIHTAQTQTARDRLHAMTERATEAWLASLVPASKRGDHRPAKDLLLATKVIDPDQHAPHVTIQLGVQIGSSHGVGVEVVIPTHAKHGGEYTGPLPALDVPALPPVTPPVPPPAGSPLASPAPVHVPTKSPTS